MKIKHCLPVAILLCLGGIVEADTIYAVDSGTGMIDQFDSSGNYLGSFNALSPGVPSAAISLDNAGNIYVTMGRSPVEKFDSSGNPVTSFLPAGDGLGLALDAGGNLYETENDLSLYVEKISSTGVDFGTFATISNGTPAGLAFDHSGNLYVAIGGGDLGQAAVDGPDTIPTIEKFDSSGNDLGNFIQSASLVGIDNARIRNLAFDVAGDLYAVDNGGEVYEFDSTGALMNKFGPLHSTINSTGISILGNGDIVISSQTTLSEYSPTGVPIGVLADTSDPASPLFGQPVNWTAIAVQPAPEPTSLGLLGLGGWCLAVRKRRRLQLG